MKNKKKVYDKLENDIDKFLKENEWNIYRPDSFEFQSYFYTAGLYEFPYDPKYLIEKHGQKLWLFYFWKGAYPMWKQGNVTGFDWDKYQMMLGLTNKTLIPCAIIFSSELDDTIIFRQLDQLPKPKHSFSKKENCRRAYEPGAPLSFRCYHCWMENPGLYRMCKHEKKKIRTGLAVWEKELFTNDTSHQPQLI